MADLCDKQTDPAITEACRQHMKECAACRAYYEDFMHTVNLLTPKYAPSFGKTQPAVSISPLQTTAKPKKHPSHKWIQIAAAVAIFMAGLGTGLSNFFSTQAEAVPSIPLIFDQSIKSSRSAASFSMSVYARTTPNENFAYINPKSGFMRISLESLRQNQKTFWRLEKEGGRTIVSDDGKQYMWTTGGLAVCGDEKCNFAEGFSSLLRPETLLEQQKAALSGNPQAHAEMTETDSTITIVTHTDVYGNAVSASLLEKEEKSYRCTTENVFSKRDGLLQQVQIWWERDGQKNIGVEKRTYCLQLATRPQRARATAPTPQQVTWLSAQYPVRQRPGTPEKTNERNRTGSRTKNPEGPYRRQAPNGRRSTLLLHGPTSYTHRKHERLQGFSSQPSQRKERL